GDIYGVGSTLSGNWPLVNALNDSCIVCPFLTKAFICKLTAAGDSLIYSSFHGGYYADIAYGVAVDANGYSHVTGYTASQNFPTTAGAIKDTCYGCVAFIGDAFYSKFSPNGDSLVYSTYLGDTSGLGASTLDVGNDIVLDASGNVYIAGHTESPDYHILNAAQSNCLTCPVFEAFVTKINPSGAIVYSTYLGDSAVDIALGIAVDATGKAIVVGSTRSKSFPLKNPLTGQGVCTSCDSLTSAFITQLNASGNAFTFSTYYGGTRNDIAHGVTMDGDGNVYIVGETTSSNFPVVNPYQGTIGGGSDIFGVFLYKDLMTVPFSSFYGGSADEYGVDITGTDLLITGNTKSGNFPTISGAYSNTCVGCDSISQALILRLNCGPQDTIRPTGPVVGVFDSVQLCIEPPNVGGITVWSTGDVSECTWAKADGWYYMTYTNADSCKGKDSINVMFTSNIDPNVYNKLTVYPNPNDGHFNVELTLIEDAEVKMSLRNLLGIEVLHIEQHASRKFDYQINITDLSPGIYLLQMKAGEQIWTEKIVVE
ncbi:MAG: SBBP repeat-containing protein, partial [Bacteroidetes bacterium]|nr:SBBP repeat-containing protein [Bacteroidota bacterium]